MKSAEEIVRALGECEPLVADTNDGRSPPSSYCVLCGDAEHTKTCPYRMSVEWAAEQDRRERRMENSMRESIRSGQHIAAEIMTTAQEITDLCSAIGRLREYKPEHNNALLWAFGDAELRNESWIQDIKKDLRIEIQMLYKVLLEKIDALNNQLNHNYEARKTR